jgi:hypothetical protein
VEERLAQHLNLLQRAGLRHPHQPLVAVLPRTGPVRIFPIVVIIDLRLRSPQPIGIWRVPYPGTNGFREFDAALSGGRPEHFNVSWCEQKRTAVVSKGGQFVVSKTGRASKSGRFACSAWPLNAGRAHPTEKTVREGLTSAPPNLRKQRTSPGLVRLACPCRFKLQSEKSQGVWGTASPSSPQAFNQKGLSAFANYKA